MSAKVFFQKSEANENASWILIFFLSIVVFGIQIVDPFNIDPWGFAPLASAITALGIASIFYSKIRQKPNFVAMFTGLVQALLFTALGSILSYMFARYSGSLWDAQLEKWDAALGFSWIQAAYLLDANPWAIRPLQFAYASLIPQVVVLILAFGFSGKIAELHRFNFSVMASGTIVIFMFPFFGALSNYVYHGFSYEDFKNFAEWNQAKSIQDFVGLRDRKLTDISLVELEGIITFPSYHAGLATVTLWGFIATRIRFLQFFGGAIALTTIVATPVEGGHFLVDVIAGFLIGAFAVALSRPTVRLDFVVS